MSFSEKINLLQSIYRKLHDLSNQISGASFAEDRGYLSDEDKKEVEQKQKEYDQLEIEEARLRENIKAEFPEEYKQHLATIQAKLTTIQNHLNAVKEALEFKQSFNKTLCESLLPDLSKLLQNKNPKNSFHWIFDVSASLIEEYKILF
jgi:hypothetical protein